MRVTLKITIESLILPISKSLSFIGSLPDKILIGLIAFAFGLPISYNAYALTVGKTAAQHVVCYSDALQKLGSDDKEAVRRSIESGVPSLKNCWSYVDARKGYGEVLSDIHSSLN